MVSEALMVTGCYWRLREAAGISCASCASRFDLSLFLVRERTVSIGRLELTTSPERDGRMEGWKKTYLRLFYSERCQRTLFLNDFSHTVTTVRVL